MAPAYKIYFFNAMGRAEGARLILAHAGVKYEDHRIAEEDWPKMKPDMPFGKVPVLEVDGVRIGEGRAIERFLARKYDLGGKNPLEAALCDMIVDALHDLTASIIYIRTEENGTKKEELKQIFVSETLPAYADKLEKLLIENGTGFIIGNSITWADIILAYVTTSIDDKVADTFKSQPNIREHYQKIMNLPNIKKWVEERPKTRY